MKACRYSEIKKLPGKAEELLDESDSEVSAFIAGKAAPQLVNEKVSEERGRTSRLEEIERLVRNSAPQSEINAAFLSFLKE